MSEHKHRFLLRWEPDPLPEEFASKPRRYWAQCKCGEPITLRDFITRLHRVEVERDRLLRTMKLIRVQTEVRHARKLADFAVEHQP